MSFVVFVQLKKSHQVGRISMLQGYPRQLSRRISKRFSAALARRVDMKLNDLIERIELPGVHIGSRMAQV